ncbi:hypothetical protein GV794_29080, partial [Nocardia cyriacigeorgica]
VAEFAAVLGQIDGGSAGAHHRDARVGEPLREAERGLAAELAGESGVRALRHRLGVRPVFKTVDTCAAEFEAKTPYHY